VTYFCSFKLTPTENKIWNAIKGLNRQKPGRRAQPSRGRTADTVARGYWLVGAVAALGDQPFKAASRLPLVSYALREDAS